MSAATKGKPKPWLTGANNPNYQNKVQAQPEATKKFKEAVKVRGQSWTTEQRQAHSARMKTGANAMRGKQHSDKTKKVLSDAKRKQYREGTISIARIKVSKAEKEILKWLTKEGFNVFAQHRIKGVRFVYDFYFPELNLIIEYNGDYWHCNPQKYKSGTYVNKQRAGPVLVDDVWARDKEKRDAASSKGIKVLYLWESEYKKDGIEAIKKLLQI